MPLLLHYSISRNDWNDFFLFLFFRTGPAFSPSIHNSIKKLVKRAEKTGGIIEVSDPLQVARGLHAVYENKATGFSSFQTSLYAYLINSVR
jgi:hypothetical protein